VSDQEKKPKEDDVEGHSYNPDQTNVEDKDVEGHLLDQTNVEDPDVEGHMYEPSQTNVDQTNVD
jgi:hypothetical protein